jgi:hypothetical protein
MKASIVLNVNAEEFKALKKLLENLHQSVEAVARAYGDDSVIEHAKLSNYSIRMRSPLAALFFHVGVTESVEVVIEYELAAQGFIAYYEAYGNFLNTIMATAVAVKPLISPLLESTRQFSDTFDRVFTDMEIVE